MTIISLSHSVNKYLLGTIADVVGVNIYASGLTTLVLLTNFFDNIYILLERFLQSCSAYSHLQIK